MRSHIEPMGERRNAHTIFVGKPEERKPMGKHGLKLENNIKMDSKETRFEDLHWINLAQNRGDWRIKLCDYRFIVLD